MTTFFALIGCLGEAALIYAVVILLQLSKKLGEVTKMKRYYRGYYASAALLFLALIVRILNASLLFSPIASSEAWQQNHWIAFSLPHNILLAIGLTIALPVTIKYWGWLLKE